MWTLHVLGPVRLTAADGTNVARLGAKTEAVLTYLATRDGHPCSRRSLVELVWPERGEAEARSALRQWLFDFGRRTGDDCPVRAEGDLLKLDGQRCRTDLEQFQQLAGSEDPLDWPQACNAFGGDLADRLSATPGFDHWLAGHREVVRASARELLARIAGHAPDGASIAAAHRLARVLIAGDPLDEDAYRALMRMQEAAGQRAKAMETWLECRRALMAEVGAQPSEATLALHRKIQQDRPAPTGVSILHALPGGAPPLRAGTDDAESAADDHVRHGEHLMFSVFCSEQANLEARRAFHAAAVICPHAVAPRFMLARAHFNEFLFGWNGDPQSHLREAMRITEALRREHPLDEMVLGMSARLAIWRGEHALAIAELRGPLSRADNPFLMQVLAEALTSAGLHGEAVVMAQRAQEAEPGNLAMFRNIEGKARFGLGDLDGALQVLSAALRRHPRHCISWSAMAAVHAELGHADEARASAIAARNNNSRYSLAFARDVLPFADEAERARWVKAWAVAGMPAGEGLAENAEVEWMMPSRAATHPVFNALVAVAGS